MSPNALKRVEIVCVVVMVVVGCLSLTGTKAEEHYGSSCPDGWIKYTNDTPHTCVSVNDDRVPLSEAYDLCAAMDSSLMMVETDEKYSFLKQIRHEYLPTWVGLVHNEDGLFWLTKDKNVTANELPSEFPHFEEYYEGLFYRYDQMYLRYSPIAYYVCEILLGCEKGWIGEYCDKQCHCYQEECDGRATEMKCRMGCEVGWMGDDCTLRRQDPDVQYFCVNTKERGMHAYIMVDTHGMKNMSIEPINDAGKSMDWCDTSIHHDHHSNLITITIHVNEYTEHGIDSLACPGKFLGDLKYEWTIKVQETSGIVSSNDIYRRLVCDFSKADDMEIGTGPQFIKREAYHRNNEVRKRVKLLEESKEKVKMVVVYPHNEAAITKQMKIGSPIAIKINYGLKKENRATGIIPFNCNATSPDLSQSVTFVDRRGCPVPGFPIKGFHDSNVSSTVVVTNAFPLFGFEKTTKVSFVCSYKLCFGEDSCHRPHCGRHPYPTTTTPGYNRSSTHGYYRSSTHDYYHTEDTTDRSWYTHDGYHHWNRTTTATTTTTRYPFRRRRSVGYELEAGQEEVVSGTVLIEACELTIELLDYTRGIGL